MQRLSGFMRTYWSRGEPGRETPRSLAVFMQRMWLAALAFKLLGSSWDVSWHFKWLRDDLAPPHIVNTIGTGIAIGLVLSHTFTGYGVEKRSLRLMQWGTGIFVVAGPIDVINHRINGLDLTSWSPSHLLLYFGTFIMIMGVIRNWYRTYPSDGTFRWQWIGRADRAVRLPVRGRVLPAVAAGVRDSRGRVLVPRSPRMPSRRCCPSRPPRSAGRWTTPPCTTSPCRSRRGSTRSGVSPCAWRSWSSPG